MTTKLVPSSATAGFFQQFPTLVNPYNDDFVLKAVADSRWLFLGQNSYADMSTDYLDEGQNGREVRNELASFGKRVIQPDIFALIADAERNPPTVSTHSTFGVPRTTLHTSHGWRELQNIGIAAGMVGIPYASNEQASRMHQFLKYHIWTASSAMVTCPSAMTDGAATLLRRHLNDKSLDAQQRAVFQDAYQRLTSLDPNYAWTSGQWMTERSGGSDVRGTETVAALSLDQDTGLDTNGMPLGPWRIDGFKWFSSATDSQMTVLLAKTDKGGLSAFLAPMRKRLSNGTITMNGVSIQRLKPKLGTRSLPTAELVLTDMRGWLIGKEGEGVREISAILNITRIHNALGALGYWGRALVVVRAYARVRKVLGGLLQDNPLFIRNLARNTVSYAGQMQIGFFVVHLLDLVEKSHITRAHDGHSSIDAGSAIALLRLLTPVAKAQCSKEAIYGVQECMECLGGVGYIEDEQDFNIARMYRDCNVLSIWEGTTDVMASDVVRVLKGRTGGASLQAFMGWAGSASAMWSEADFEQYKQHFTTQLDRLTHLAALPAPELLVRGRELLELLAWLTASVLLLQTAVVTKDELSKNTARQWLERRLREAPNSELSLSIDRKLAFGNEQGNASKL